MNGEENYNLVQLHQKDYDALADKTEKIIEGLLNQYEHLPCEDVLNIIYDVCAHNGFMLEYKARDKFLEHIRQDYEQRMELIEWADNRVQRSITKTEKEEAENSPMRFFR